MYQYLLPAAKLLSTGALLGGAGLGAVDLYKQFTDKDRLISDFTNIDENEDGIRKLNPYQSLRRISIDTLNPNETIDNSYIQDETDIKQAERIRRQLNREKDLAIQRQEVKDAGYVSSVAYRNEEKQKELEALLRKQDRLTAKEAAEAIRQQQMYGLQSDRLALEGKLASEQALLAQLQQNQQNEMDKFYYLEQQKALDRKEKRREAIMMALMGLTQGVGYI
tara:strand:- start:391 stop:1056 length:666 start_codon:yes stop_codon:yes gene_type:complete